MNILVTGGSGLIGSTFINQYADDYHFTVLTRDEMAARKKLPDNCHYISDLCTLSDLNDFDAVINLAGEPIVDKRWTASQKAIIEKSRFETTQQLVDLCNRSSEPPATFISGSAIGFYGRQSDRRIDETFANVNEEYSHQLCKQWETIAQQASTASTRVCILRTGIVLAEQGGALSKMLLPFKCGLGGPIASGKQYMSWIHINDMVRGIAFLLNTMHVSGVFNFTAPEPVSNRMFTRELGKALNRPAMLPMPAFALRVLMGESADLLIYGQRVLPSALIGNGFQFSFSTVDDALTDLLVS